MGINRSTMLVQKISKFNELIEVDKKTTFFIGIQGSL